MEKSGEGHSRFGIATIDHGSTTFVSTVGLMVLFSIVTCFAHSMVLMQRQSLVLSLCTILSSQFLQKITCTNFAQWYVSIVSCSMFLLLLERFVHQVLCTATMSLHCWVKCLEFVSCELLLSFVAMMFFHQMRVRPLARTGEQCDGGLPARMYARVPVLRMDNGNDSFFVAATQHSLLFKFAAPLTVRAIMTLPETGHLPYQHLPALNEDVAFMGEIASFKLGCLVVLVDAHTLFPLTDWVEDNSSGQQW